MDVQPMFHSARINRGGSETWKEPMASLGLWLDQPTTPDDDLRIGDILAIIRRNIASILGLTLLGLGLGLAYIALKTPVYASLTQILVEPRSRTAVDSTGNTAPGQIIPDPGIMESQEKILRSYAILSRVVARENLTQDREFTESRWEWLTKFVKIGPFRDKPAGPGQENAAELKAIQTLVEKINIKRATNSYVIDAEVNSEDPVKAARIARALAEALLADQSDAKAGEARQANTMLDSRLGELREKVRLADTAVEDFRLRNGLLLATGSLVNEQQLAQVNTGLVQAQAATAEARARFERMQRLVQSGGVPDTVNESFSSIVVQRLREQYAAAAQREAALASRLQGGHPDMADIRSRLGSLRGQLNAELKRILDGSRSEFEIARSREAQYVERSEAIKKETNDKNQARVQLAALERDAAAPRKQLETFLGRERDTREQQQLFTPDARIITPALVPNRAASPNKPLVLLLSLLGGLSAGLAHAMLRAQMDGKVRDGETIQRDAGLRFAMALPAFSRSRLRRVLNFGSKGSRTEQSSAAFLQVLESLSLRGGATADPYRAGISRLTSQLRGSRLDAPAKCLLVVSPSAGEGKSCLALALAQAEAQGGHRTLLIDADFRNPDLSAVFAPNAASEASAADLEAATYKSMVYAFDEADADLLPLSAIMLHLGRQMRVKQMVEGLSKIAESYDRVIIDGGALLDDGITSAIMNIADQVILVARSGETESADLIDAARSIDIPLDRRSGVVLTMSPKAARQRLARPAPSRLQPQPAA
jgi:polysaccharide biosynthesis transport protein